MESSSSGPDTCPNSRLGGTLQSEGLLRASPPPFSWLEQADSPLERLEMRRKRSGIPRGVPRVSLAGVRSYLRFCEVKRTAPRVSELARKLAVSRGTLISAVK